MEALKYIIQRVMFKHGNHKCVILILILMFAVSLTKAQDTLPSKSLHPELYVTLQNGSDLYLVNSSGDTAKAEWVSPAYLFDMVFDSTAVTTYIFTECKRNGTLLPLVLWADGRVVNADADLLSFNSTTDTFTCHTGDTLSMYRSLSWRNPITSVQDTGNYYALDSLDFSIELVRASDSNRAALLDTIGILANSQPDAPRIHGMRALMSTVNYVVPSGLNNVKVFLRLRVYHRGSGQYWFTRSDQVTIGLSQQLNDSDYQDFINIFTPVSPKPTILDFENRNSRLHSEADLRVNKIAGSSRTLEIVFDTDPHGGPVTLAIFDVMGVPKFYPYSSSGSKGKVRVEYTFEDDGVYFIGLFHNGRLINVKKVVIA